MKRALCFLLILIWFALTLLSVSAVTIKESRTYLFADHSGAYSVTCSGKHISLTRYSLNEISAELDLSYAVTAVCCSNGRVVLLCDDTAHTQLVVYVYEIESDMLDSFAIYGARVTSGTDFCCTDRAIYLENAQNNLELTAYSYSGNKLDSYRFSEEITDVFPGYDHGVFVVGNHMLYTLDGNRFTAVSGGDVEPHLFAADSRVIASECGAVYLLEGNRISRYFTVDTDYHASSACLIGDRLYYPCGNEVFGYDIDTGEKVSRYRLSFSNPLLFSDGNSIKTVSASSSVQLRPSDFADLRQRDNSSGNTPPSPGRTNHTSQNTSSGTADYELSSPIYRIDFEHYQISGIDPGTTVAEFKSHMNYTGYSVTIYRENTIKTGGNVGTGMIAVFASDQGSLTFELAVTGDITGEGNQNSRDLNLLMDYLIGKADFNGVYAIAADVSKDQSVNVVDLAILKRSIG